MSRPAGLCDSRLNSQFHVAFLRRNVRGSARLPWDRICRDGSGLCDSPLEGDGFELFVPRHESPEFGSIPGVAGSSCAGSGDVGGGLHRRYRGGPSDRGFVLSCTLSTRNDACPAAHRDSVFVAARRPSRGRLRRRAIAGILSHGSVLIFGELRLTTNLAAGGRAPARAMSLIARLPLTTISIEEVSFASDSALQGDGFEPTGKALLRSGRR